MVWYGYGGGSGTTIVHGTIPSWQLLARVKFFYLRAAHKVYVPPYYYGKDCAHITCVRTITDQHYFI